LLNLTAIDHLRFCYLNGLHILKTSTKKNIRFHFNKQLDADYVSHLQEYLLELIGALKGMGSFWQLPEL